LFHARRPAVAKERSPNDESVRGTATVNWDYVAYTSYIAGPAVC